jgi:hypothetical protein
VSAPDETRASSAGDRAVAIAGFLALLLVGFFGDEPKPVPMPVPLASSTHGAQR